MRVGLVSSHGDIDHIFEYNSVGFYVGSYVADKILTECNMPFTKEEMVKRLKHNKSNKDKLTQNKLRFLYAVLNASEKIDDNTFIDLCDIKTESKYHCEVLVLENDLIKETVKSKRNKYSEEATPNTYVGFLYERHNPYKTYLFFDSREELEKAYDELMYKGYLLTDNARLVVNEHYQVTEVYTVNKEQAK